MINFSFFYNSSGPKFLQIFITQLNLIQPSSARNQLITHISAILAEKHTKVP